MRIMAIDYGDARTGVAISDATGLLAGFTTVIHGRKSEMVAAELARLVREHGVEELVLGLPRNMDGTEGARAQKSRKLAALVEQASGLPVRMWDERQTTITAAGFLSESGTFGKKRKAVLDAVSASVILENYLAWRKNHPGER